MERLLTAIIGDEITFQSIDRNLALIATMMVLRDIKTAPAAGDSNIP